MNTDTKEQHRLLRRQRREQRRLLRQLKTILSQLTPHNRDRVLRNLLKHKFVDTISEDQFPKSTQLIHNTRLLIKALNQENKEE
jgi:hypothetical protein